MASYSYSGNNDFRGYIAANYKPLLGFVGNDGGVNWNALNKAGGVDLYQGNSADKWGSYTTGGTADLVNKLYKGWQGMYANDLKASAQSANDAVASAIAALNAQPRLPSFDWAGAMATAGATAANTVNPVYQDKLNQYLAKVQASLAQKQTQVTRNKQDITTALTQALEDSALSRARTQENTTTQLGDITANENSWQRQEGRQFDAARMALLDSIGNSGLGESGIGRQQEANAITDRNLQSEDQTRAFNNQRRDIQTIATRTLADLDRSDARQKTSSQRATEDQDIDLNNFIQNANLDEQSFRATNEMERIGAINSATQSAYSQMVAQAIQALAGSGARAQDIALFRQVYGG